MKTEIERKFLIRKMPSLVGIKPVLYERYYLFVGNGIELRIQSKDGRHEIERKEEIQNLSRNTRIMDISKEEFEALKKFSDKAIIRESYAISKDPNISIKIYQGEYEGLTRVEVEFNSEEEAKSFVSPDWFGKEITDTPLGRDSRLINLSYEEFSRLLNG